MKQSRRDTDSFDDQLQGKLSQLSQRRSQKKIKMKPLLQNHLQENKKYYDDCAKILTYSNHEQPFNSANFLDLNKDKDYKQQAISYRKKTVITEQVKNQNPINNIYQKIKDKQDQRRSTFAGLSNKQLAHFLKKNMPQNNSLDLSYFLAKCLTEFSEENQLNEEQIKLIFLQLQQQITTTDPNTISINALQLALKKKSNSLQIYIAQKIAKSKIQISNAKIKQKQRKMQKSLHQYSQFKQQIQRRQKQLLQMQNNLKQREKQIIKKQKAYGNKQKQLMERIKGHKKMLQQKAQKLSEAHLNQLNSVFQKVQKKINTYQRNMKYRVQSLNQKMNQIHRLRQYKQSDIRNSVARQIQEKYQKINANKIKKLENEIKQINNKYQNLKKQLKESQDQNNKLMKICSKLENKISKQQNKMKDLTIQVDNKNIELRQLKFLCAQKQKQNEQLMNKIFNKNDQSLNQYENEQSSDKKPDKKENNKQLKQSKLGVSKSKRSLTNKNKLQGSNNKDKKNSIQNVIEIPQIIQVYQMILSCMVLNDEISTNIFASGKMKYLLELSTKLFVRGFYCYSLIKFIECNIVNVVCSQMNNLSNNEKSSIKSMLNQLQSYYSNQNSQLLQKYMRLNKSKKSSKLTNEQQNKYNICLYKLQIVYCLISNNKQAEYWLEQISQIKQIGYVEQQMYSQIHNRQTNNNYSNFILAIIIKFFVPKHQPNINILQQCSDLILKLKLINTPKFDEYWENNNNIANLIIKDFINIIKIILQNEQYYNKYGQQIQRISILIQRFIVGCKIQIKNSNYQYFDKLRMKCKGTLLQMNLNSILQIYQKQGKQILKQLDQICDD